MARTQQINIENCERFLRKFTSLGTRGHAVPMAALQRLFEKADNDPTSTFFNGLRSAMELDALDGNYGVGMLAGYFLARASSRSEFEALLEKFLTVDMQNVHSIFEAKKK